MALNFPDNPTLNQTYAEAGKVWIFNGSRWAMLSPAAFTLADGAVTTAKILDENVTTAKIANSNVTAAKIASDAVTEAKIASNAVTEAKIANSSITTAKIAAGAVEESDIASSAVTEAKIASNAVTTGKLGTDVQLGYRNVVINGAMQVAQRGTSTASITTESLNTADRWRTVISSLGTWTQTVENDAPTGSGFRKSLKMNCTTADASPSAGDYLTIATKLEGQNVQQFLKGTASAKQFSLSFWVKSNVTGTYIAELIDNDNTRRVSISYSVSASATWEKKTITFPADTTGVLDNDNAASLDVNFWLGAGSTFTGGSPLQTTWGTATATRATGQTNLANATSNYWQITGVQLEAGSVATPFEFEDLGVTLAKCQRYYHLLASGAITSSVIGMGANITTTEVWTAVSFPVSMRAAPTLVASSGTSYYDFIRNNADDFFNSFTIEYAHPNGAMMKNTSEISGTAGDAGLVRINNASASVAFSAEL